MKSADLPFEDQWKCFKDGEVAFNGNFQNFSEDVNATTDISEFKRTL